MLHLATGAGKTVIFCEVLKSAEAKGTKCLMVVRGKKLVDQASERLDREGVDHGVIMSGHPRVKPDCLIQLASIDTLYARRNKRDYSGFKLIVIDEAHLATSDAYMWLVNLNPSAFYLPVTATPYHKRGFKHIADCVVNPISLSGLIAGGFLVAPRYFAPSLFDVKGIKIDSKTGDFSQRELEERAIQTNLFGDIVKSYKKLSFGLPALCFAVSVEHSKMIVDKFNAAGIAADHLDATSNTAKRLQTLQKFESGETKVLSSVGILTTGVDIPHVRTLILARPTMSYTLYIQMLGRGTRPYKGKDHFLVLDHAGNIHRHGFIENELPANLNGTPDRKALPSITTCDECYYTYYPSEHKLCPGCGAETKIKKDHSRKANIDTTVELKELSPTIKKHMMESTKGTSLDQAIYKWVNIAIQKDYKPRWVYYKLANDPRFGHIVAQSSMKKVHEVFKIIGEFNNGET